MLWIVPLLAGLGCAAVIYSSARSGNEPAEVLAWSLAAIAVIANAGWYYGAMWLLPVIDLHVGFIALWLHPHGQKKWVALFIHAVWIRLVLHMLDALTAHQFFVPYIHALNATYAWMLIVVANGGHNGRPIWRNFRDLLRRLRCVGRSPAYSFREMNGGR